MYHHKSIILTGQDKSYVSEFASFEMETDEPIRWVGESVRTMTGRMFYDCCEYKGDEYHIYDCVMLRAVNAEATHKVARVMSLYEFNGSKKATLEWFYRSDDVVNHITKMKESDMINGEDGLDENGDAPK